MYTIEDLRIEQQEIMNREPTTNTCVLVLNCEIAIQRLQIEELQSELEIIKTFLQINNVRPLK